MSHVFLDVDAKVLSKWERGILRLDKTLVTVNLVLSGGPRCFVVGCACPEALFWGCGGGFHPVSTFAGSAHSSSATRVLQPPLCGRVLASLSPRTACDHAPPSGLLRLPASARPCRPRHSVKNESAVTGTCTRRTHCSGQRLIILLAACRGRDRSGISAVTAATAAWATRWPPWQVGPSC